MVPFKGRLERKRSFLSKGEDMDSIEEVQGKINSLFEYRNSLDDSERELFDVLISYANEIVLSIDRNVIL